MMLTEEEKVDLGCKTSQARWNGASVCHLFPGRRRSLCGTAEFLSIELSFVMKFQVKIPSFSNGSYDFKVNI